MTDDSTGMFKSVPSALAVIDLEKELEKAVCVGVNLTRRTATGIKFAPRELENKTLPIIREILENVNPEMLGNVLKIDARVVWEVYWYLRSKPGGLRTCFFALLIDLNKNPSFTSLCA